MNNDSQLSLILSYKRNERLSLVNIIDYGILKIIAKLDSNKGHGHDKTGLCMIEICCTSTCKPLRLIFNHCIDSGIYPCDWKKANVVPIHKKGDKQTLKIYRPVSLLPIYSKIFERLLYNEKFVFFLDKGLISANQSGLKPGDSCINQLLSITHNILNSFNDVYDEVRGAFLDISPASSQEHLGLTLDYRLTFDKHLKNVSNKISKTIGLLRPLQSIYQGQQFLQQINVS